MTRQDLIRNLLLATDGLIALLLLALAGWVLTGGYEIPLFGRSVISLRNVWKPTWVLLALLLPRAMLGGWAEEQQRRPTPVKPLLTGLLLLLSLFILLNAGRRSVLDPILLLTILLPLRLSLEDPLHRSRNTAAVLLCLTMFVFLVNKEVYVFGDMTPATFLPVSILTEFDFDLDEFPFLYERGTPYYLKVVDSHYLSAYPVGAALVALPFYIVPVLLSAPLDPRHVAEIAKVAAATIMAVSVLFLYLALGRVMRDSPGATLTTLAYAFGTSSYSSSAQALWQHGPSQLFLTLTIYFICRGVDDRRSMAYTGFSLAAAVACRPPNILFLAPFGIYFLLNYRDQLARFLVFASPPTAFLVLYNIINRGSPLATGYENLIERFSSSFGEGLAGILLSPSRGLFVYSPVLLFSLWGVFLAWRRPGYLHLRYLSVGCLLTVLLYSRWGMWWGGYSFGPRLLADLTPFLSLLLYPVWEEGKLRRGPARIAFWALLALSVLLHTMGANLRAGWDSEPNIDQHTERLWSLVDSQPVYYARQLFESMGGLRRMLPSLGGITILAWYLTRKGGGGASEASKQP